MSQLVEGKTNEGAKAAKAKGRKKPANPRGVVSVLNGDYFTKDNLIKNIPFLFYVTFLLVLYIGYGYYVDKTSDRIVELEAQSREMKADLNNENAYYNQMTMYSHVEDSLKADGLVPSLKPAVKIEVSPDQFKVRK